ncbi:MAG: helix-turn-helix transcriptional regulator, partial [Pseudolysinimonas sp.]
ELLGVVASEPTPKIFAAEVSLAMAAMQMAHGHAEAAQDIALAAARRARSEGQPVAEMGAWYDAIRYGSRAAAKQFLRASHNSLGEGRSAQRAYARSVLADDASGVEDAATALDRAGLGWFAVEAQASAVRMQRAVGAVPATERAVARLRALAAQHPGVRSSMSRERGGIPLTARELEIGLRASHGESDRQIAAAAGISVRTVQTHLARAYAKLSVHSRSELAVILSGAAHPTT